MVPDMEILKKNRERKKKRDAEEVKKEVRVEPLKCNLKFQLEPEKVKVEMVAKPSPEIFGSDTNSREFSFEFDVEELIEMIPENIDDKPLALVGFVKEVEKSHWDYRYSVSDSLAYRKANDSEEIAFRHMVGQLRYEERLYKIAKSAALLRILQLPKCVLATGVRAAIRSELPTA